VFLFLSFCFGFFFFFFFEEIVDGLLYNRAIDHRDQLVLFNDILHQDKVSATERRRLQFHLSLPFDVTDLVA